MTVSELLRQNEGKTLEFKREISSPINILKTVVAFANTAGGLLLIGMDNNTRKPVGIDDPLEAEERLCNMIADAIRPRIVPNIEMATLEGKTLLLVEVFLSSLRPHWIKSEGPEQGVYVRLGSTNRKADRELIAELRRSVEGISFDEMPMPELSIDDLDLDAAQRAFGGERELNKQALLTLKLLVRNQGKIVPSKGGMLLFGRNRTDYFPDCWVQCGRFIGSDKARIFDHIDIDEPLPQSVDSIMLFLKKHAMRGADFSDIRRRDVWSIPLGPLREAVINALVHADYSQRGGPIRVAFFDDRIEIENPGILPPGITVEDMKQGVSKIRNPVIARVFRELKLIEQWGSGVPRIFRETAESGFPEPSIVELGLRVRFVFPLAKAITVGEPTQSQPESRPELRLKSRLESRLKSPLAAKVVLFLEEEPSGKAGLAKKLGHKTVSGELHKQIRRLLEMGLIEMTIPEKPNSRLQKYRLTEKGKQALEEEKEKK